MLLRSGVAVAVVLGMVAALGAADAHAQEHDASEDFDLLAASSSPVGIWSDGTTMWVADSPSSFRVDDRIYAYDMTTKERDSAKDFDTLYAAGYRDIFGIWSDGTTMWVADYRYDKIYAYAVIPGTGSGPGGGLRC